MRLAGLTTLFSLTVLVVIGQLNRGKSASAVASTPYVSSVWVSDLGNGLYKNPVLNADYDWFRVEPLN